MQDIARFTEELKGRTAEEILAWVLEHFGRDAVALASSLGAEDQVLTNALLKIDPKASIFTIDTGRLPQESYDLMQKTMEAYDFHYEILFPEEKEVAALVAEHGPNLFYKSVDLRKACCHVRKVAPLQKKLATLKAWICGLRRVQSVTRADVQAIEWDATNGLVKVNPLVNWSEEQVWAYIREHKVPYNALHDRGYPSIGCAPCTRAITPGEDVRAGRWWWESPEHKECGLHEKHKKV